MPAKAARPAPVGGLVPWRKMLCPILACRPHPVLHWLYTLKEEHDGTAPVLWCNVTQQELVDAMNAWARFKVGQSVHIGAFSPRYIRRRQWDFRRGCFLYIIEGNRDGREVWMDEKGLLEAQPEGKQEGKGG
jgi:hypothetical protein